MQFSPVRLLQLQLQRTPFRRRKKPRRHITAKNTVGQRRGRLAQFLASRTFPASYRVFLVNEGNRDISSIEMSTGGFEGTADTVTELNRLTKNLGPLKQGGSLLFEELDFGMLDFVLTYYFQLTFYDEVQIEGSFSIDKAYSLRPGRYRFSQALGREAFLFEMSGT